MSQSPFPRVFRLAEANAMLPMLTQIIADLRTKLETARALQRELRMIEAVGHDESGVLIMAEDYRTCRARFRATAEEIDDIVERVHRRGCQLKSIELGIVDFPGVVDGEPVLFCWRFGEPEIAFYHGINDGFAGRRPLRRGSIDTGPDDGDGP